MSTLVLFMPIRCRVAAVLVIALALPLAAQAVEPHPEVVAKLKQLHTAFEKYRQDHDGYYPPLAVKNDGGSMTLWPELLKPYLNDNSKVGRVDVNGPFFAPYLSLKDRRGGKVAAVSFGYSRYAIGADAPRFKRGRHPVRVVPYPSKTLLLVECEALRQSGIGWYESYPNGGFDFKRYKGKAHVLFCDGRVALWSQEELDVGGPPSTNRAPWFGDLSKQAYQKKPARAPAEKAPVEKKAAGKPHSAAKSDGTIPYVTVARIARAPAIDGKLRSGEWDGCSAFAGYRNYITGKLDVRDVATLCGYDARALYLCFVVPLKKGEQPNAHVTRRDGPVYKEDAIELFFEPESGAPIRQIIVNAIGTVYDCKGAEKKWRGEWQIATAQGTADDLPQEMGFDEIEAFWCLEMALPFAELQVSPPRAGTLWRVNFCLDGSRPLTFAPTFGSYSERARLAYLRFLAAGEPSLHLTSLGKVAYGRLALSGRLNNPSRAAADFRFRVLAQKKGTKIVEKTGFNEIVGARTKFEESLSVPAGQRKRLDITRELDDPRLEELHVSIERVSESGKVTRLYANRADLHILPPFRLLIENYPTAEYLICRMDTAGLAGSIKGVKAHWRIVAEKGRTAISSEVPLMARNQTLRIAYGRIEPGQYALNVDLVRGGKEFASRKRPFTRVKNPAWFRNDIGKSRIVVPPFTPMEYDARQVRMWGRQMTWTEKSLLPSEVISTGRELLAGPIRLVVAVAGKERRIPLDRFAFTAKDKDRGEMTLSGSIGTLKAEASAWVEYDGLLWLDLTLRASDGRAMDIETCRLELPLRKDEQLYYHGVPDRSLTGAVENKTLEFPFQFYFWVGSCDRGIGFVTESMKNMLLPEKKQVYRIIPKTDHVLWQVNLIERPVRLSSLNYRFGLQATPVKPLPPDYHSWLVAFFEDRRGNIYNSFTDNVDFGMTGGHLKGSPAKRWGNAFCDPMGIRTHNLAPIVAKAHKRHTPLIPYFAPISFTDNARPEHDTYAHEWMVKPRRRWKDDGFTQTRTCLRNSWRDWLLYSLRKVVRESGVDGLYFDGTYSGPCRNTHHGCGWMDEKGRLQPTWAVLAGREFNKRIAVMLHEEVEHRALKSPAAWARPGWPHSYCWTHLSGAVCPPIVSFNTAYFCGEWFKGAIKRGKGYDELLTLDTFRPRYLSTAWGVPNYFLAITVNRKGGKIAFDSQNDATKETELILSYMLPQGVPLWPRYLDREIRRSVIQTMIAFKTRSGEYTPAWRNNAHIRLDAAGNRNILLATWARDSRLLVVVGNVGKAAATVTLNSLKHKRVKITHVFPKPAAAGSVASDGRFPLTIGPLTFRLMLIDPA